jgi:CIC family chloride channel protein
MRRYIRKLHEPVQLIVVAIFVGIGGALASVALNRSLEHGAGLLADYRGTWYAFIFPAVGAGLAVLFLHRAVRDTGGHGVPEVIYAISRRGGLLRLRTGFSRLVACLLTIAGGGSAGPEAPVVISGASIGSNIGRYFKLRDRQRIVVVGCGAAAAIAAIFNAPVTGIVFTLEAIVGEWTPRHLIPVSIASVVATELSRLLQGNQIPFEYRVFSISAWDLAACVGLAVLAALVSVALMRALRHSGKWFNRVKAPVWIRAALGGVCVGVIGVFFPEVLGEGYHVIGTIIEEEFSSGLLLAGVLVVAKIVATSATLGSGGAGGVFAPCLVVGCLTGLFYQQLLTGAVPNVTWAGQGYFGLLGMAGVISGVLQAPMTGVFLVAEITGSYQFLLSVVLVAVVSVTVTRFFEPSSVYHQELIARGALIKPRTDRQILASLNMKEILETDCRVIHPEMRLKDLVSLVQQSHRNYFPVEDAESGEFIGMISMDDIRAYLFDTRLHDALLAEELVDRGVDRVSPEDDLETVFEVFDRTHVWSLPVVQDGQFLGLISKATVLDHYRKEMLANEEF